MDATYSQIGEERISDLRNLVKGGDDSGRKYLRVCDLNQETKNSVVLKNAYQVCLHSKNFS